MNFKKKLSENKKLISFFTANILASEYLNIDNLEEISKEEILKIEKLFETKFFYIYKKKLFWKWDKKNFENTTEYYKKFFKIFRKLNIKFEDFEKNKLELYKAKYFTKVRNLKTMETPYKKEGVNPIIYFNYKDVSLFSQNGFLFDKVVTSNLGISYNEMVFYNKKNKEINLIFYVKDIKEIFLKEKWVEIILKNKKVFFLRYLENEIIYISLRRIWSKQLNFF
ncbi:MAG: hypothetical protein HPAVJP_1040 [Candidatus Hepatoplasma vulgare]|nr:MAG: hypothetical protein HPAVJP_1040 [Candidatus Hepatoplasma sp.]